MDSEKMKAKAKQMWSSLTDKAKKEANERGLALEVKKKTTKCHKCGKMGHIAVKCRNQRIHTTMDDGQWMILNTLSLNDSNDWVLDTGASISCVGRDD